MSLLLLLLLVYGLTSRITRVLVGAIYRWATVVIAVLIALLVTAR